MRRFLARFANLFRAGAAEREMSREIDAHVGLIQEDFERRGLSPADAKLAALRSYGGVEQSKELHREARSIPLLDHFWKDVRYGARNLLRTPGFAAIAILTLALGIGANTAIFSVVHAVLLRPLDYRDPGRLVTILHAGAAPVAAGNFIDWRSSARTLDAVAAEAWGANITGSGEPEHINGVRVTSDFLPVLGVAPALGRWFTAAEDHAGADHEVILSDRLWRRHFDSDPAVLGQPITLSGEAYTVVGIMPPGFQFAPFWASKSELCVPMPLADRAGDRGGNSLRVFGRLRPGFTLAQAKAEIATITAGLEQRYPGTNRNVVVTPLKENVVGKIETPLLIMLAAVGFVLLIACANVAHMLLARTSDRQREIAVRTALGAGRGRVTAQLLTENLLLAAAGALAGLVLAKWGTKALVALSPPKIPRLETVSVDSGVILFLLLVTVLTALVSGLAPAFHAASGNLSGALKEGGRGSSDGAARNRLRGFLVASEFALAFVLLIGAGLMIRSFAAVEAVDPGWNPHGILSMTISLTGSQEAPLGRRELFYRQLLDRVGHLPGVESAGGINHLPLAGDLWGWNFQIEGRAKPRPGESPRAVYRIAMPGYFKTMRLPIVRGRGIAATDDVSAPGVVVINQAAAMKYWPGQDPLGQRISFGSDENGQQVWLSVVGIAKDARQGDWTSSLDGEVYLAALQNRDFLGGRDSHISYITLVVRAAGDPGVLTSAVKSAVWSLDRNLPISDIHVMDDVVADATAEPRFEMLLLGAFAAVALILAAVGIYGVMAYSVARRTHELGIRVSLGAGRAEVLGMVLRQGMFQAAAGAVIGIAGALLLARALSQMLYTVKPNDPLTFAAVAVVLAVAAIAAISVPALRATRIDPMAALRNE